MNTIRKSSTGAVLLAWLIVSVPAGWGVYNTVRNALKLFHPPVDAGRR